VREGGPERPREEIDDTEKEDSAHPCDPQEGIFRISTCYVGKRSGQKRYCGSVGVRRCKFLVPENSLLRNIHVVHRIGNRRLQRSHQVDYCNENYGKGNGNEATTMTRDVVGLRQKGGIGGQFVSGVLSLWLLR